MNRFSWAIPIVFGMLTFAAQAQETSALTFSGSGFMTLGVAKMLGGTRAHVADYACPCFTSDYAQAGVFDGRNSLQWKPDTKLGVQGEVALENQQLSLTGQLVARGARDGKIDLELLYGSYKLNDWATLQVGRKRLPMFYYSDVQDIGVSLPWTHLPPQLYGWEAVNYNGANLLVQQKIGEWTANFNLLMGAESIKDAGYDKIYNGRRSRTDARWQNIVGGDLSLQKDWFEARFVYIQSGINTRNVSGTWDAALQAYDPATISTSYTTGIRQRIHGLALRAEYDGWLAHTELVHIVRPGLAFKDYANLVALGKRWGAWQATLTQSRYWGSAVVDQGGDPLGLEGHISNSLTLRYDLSISSAIKVQLDFQRDQSGPNWGVALDSASTTGLDRPYGNARLLSLTYDKVF